MVVTNYICENCGFDSKEMKIDARDDLSSVSSGDRVLVSKYEYHLRDPRRFDVPVFKYPVEPYYKEEMQGMNYIKRLVGLGGETIAVFAGDLYTTRKLTYDHIPLERRPQNDLDAWQFRYMYTDDQVAKEFFRSGGFEMIRKTPDQIVAVRRIVFDLDKQPKSREGIRRTRWHGVPDDDPGWAMEAAGFKHSGGDFGWMRYQHINPWNDEAIQKHLINDCVGYNNRDGSNQPFPSDSIDHWVSDLTLDCTVEIAGPENEIILELNKGAARCQAIFAKGECKLVRYVNDGDKESMVEMGSHATKITKGGKFALRLANVDSRLTVWVDDKPIPFSKEQSDYPPPTPNAKFVPTENDRNQPARIGAVGDVKCSKVSLWRDLHYTCAFMQKGDQIERKPLDPKDIDIPDCGDVQTYFVQPGHFLMFGDNSRSSADSRSWGLVPERLMLGRAIMVYWPFSRLGVIE
jgi:signal peptidase I